MPRADLDRHFGKIDELIAEINEIVPSSSYRAVQFRADLAGLLVVAMAATYETCVKEILFEYANKKHADFGGFAMRNYEKLNSRINVKDLKRYCEMFDPTICSRFKYDLTMKKKENIRAGRQKYRGILRANIDVAS